MDFLSLTIGVLGQVVYYFVFYFKQFQLNSIKNACQFSKGNTSD